MIVDISMTMEHVDGSIIINVSHDDEVRTIDDALILLIL